jgi:hypothetical protein
VLRAIAAALIALPAIGIAQQPPYDVFPPAGPPYYRIRYEASSEPGQLAFAVSYTIWIPKDVKSLRGVIVHQHGCGEGSCRLGLTGAYDLHWQALAKEHAWHCSSPPTNSPRKRSANCGATLALDPTPHFRNVCRTWASSLAIPSRPKVP